MNEGNSHTCWEKHIKQRVASRRGRKHALAVLSVFEGCETKTPANIDMFLWVRYRYTLLWTSLETGALGGGLLGLRWHSCLLLGQLCKCIFVHRAAPLCYSLHCVLCCFFKRFDSHSTCLWHRNKKSSVCIWNSAAPWVTVDSLR